MFGSGNSNKGGGRQAVAAISTLIADGTRIRGDVHFGGGLHLEGIIEGTVSAEGADAVLTVSDKGRINGEVRVANAVINGVVKGDVHVAERLELAGNARIEGNVHYKVLEMAAGAQINGQMLYQAEQRRLPSPDPAAIGALAEA